jgi:glycosyltransferase involved in cell wall biosynthesis
MVKISIIVAVYNIESYIDKCLASLVNQTLKDIQIIVVNDGSQDNSGKIIEAYQTKYREKILYIEKANGGLSDARNAGIHHATGEYIGCVDGDDYINPAMYEKMYNEAQKENADLVECDFFYVYPHKLKQKTGELYKLKDILIKARCNAWNKIIKREIIEKSAIRYPVSLRYEDVEYFCKIVPYIKRIGLVREPLYHYIQRETSITHIQNEKTRDIFKILDHVFEYYKQKGFYTEYEKQLEYLFIKILLGGSFFRIIKIGDTSLRKAVLEENWQFLNQHFPDWNKNSILQHRKTAKDTYFRTINRFTYTIYAKLFGMITKGALF